MDITIREAANKDYDALNELFAELDEIHQTNLPQTFQTPKGAARSREYISGIVKDMGHVLLVAEHNGQIIGFVHISIKKSPAIPIFVQREYAASYP